MANYRQVHVSIWKDGWFLELTPVEKLIFIYLFSNESASLAGIYKLAFRVICFETCLPASKVKDTLKKFADADKIYYQDGIVWVKNLRKYNKGSSKVEKRIENDLSEIPDCELKQKYIAYFDPEIPYPEQNIPYPYPIDTLSTEMKTNEMNTNEYEMKENEPWEIPANLDTPAFLAAWQDFQKHRKEIRKKLTPLAGSRTLIKLARHPPEIAVRMLERSIENGWTGVFELDGDKPSTKPEKSVLEIIKDRNK